MDAARSDDIRTVRDARIDGLRAEASEAVGYSANMLRTVSQRYRSAYADEFNRWQALRDELDTVERGRAQPHHLRAVGDEDAPDVPPNPAAEAAEAGAEAARVRALRSEVDNVGTEIGRQQTELAKLEIALHNLEATWLFLERGDASLISEDGDTADVQMRIVEAQESERSRLAQEVHDGPAQTLSNAIFQVEYIERVLDTDGDAARTELRFLRELLRRELGSVRTFITQLRPPVLDELGLDGAISDAIARMTALTGLTIVPELQAAPDRLTETQQTVVLRVLQEGLQNVRKHGAASTVTVATRIESNDWILTVRDDGRGFEIGAIAARGRRNFGLQFMRERAELIGAHFEVQSRPDGGTLVKLAIPMGAEEST
ncbi:MAG: two-component system, NarL family, sensor histidine kinase DegS [Chloroflexota bacterium]|jgi:two-component system sensor histidine kinase DegS|nr:two-component system, NarL family, sensor histidine kinase DegS [Chloroflexota bacterium]